MSRSPLPISIVRHGVPLHLQSKKLPTRIGNVRSEIDALVGCASEGNGLPRGDGAFHLDLERGRRQAHQSEAAGRAWPALDQALFFQGVEVIVHVGFTAEAD